MLDGLRLVAALVVAAYHYIGMDHSVPPWGPQGRSVFPILGRLAGYGWIGVEMFFIISGFAICMSAWGRTLGDFFRSRVSRLFPAYWFGVIVTFAVVSLTPSLFRTPPSPTDAVVNLTMLQDPLHVPRVDDIYWTLWNELRFYLLFAAVVAMGLTYRRVIGFCLLWTVGAAIGAHAGWKLIYIVTMPDSAPYFLVGIGLYLIHRFGHQLLTWLVIAANAALCLHNAVTRMQHQAASVVHHHLHTWVVGAVLLATGLLILATARGRMDWVRWRWVTTAGALTYPFYLVHESIGYVVIHWLYTRASLAAYLVLPLTVVLMLGLAWSVHRLVERPLSRFLRRHLAGTALLDLPEILPISRSRSRTTHATPPATEPREPSLV